VDTAQFRDNIATLHTLVFELQQEVADLHHRVEAMEIKVTNLLQILASMHEALCPNSEEEATVGDPEVEGDYNQRPGTSPPDKSRDEEMYEERNQEHDAHGGDWIVDDEKEPGLGDPPATWPSGQPGV
jgi:hypothetical protein